MCSCTLGWGQDIVVCLLYSCKAGNNCQALPFAAATLKFSNSDLLPHVDYTVLDIMKANLLYPFYLAKINFTGKNWVVPLYIYKVQFSILIKGVYCDIG